MTDKTDDVSKALATIQLGAAGQACSNDQEQALIGRAIERLAGAVYGALRYRAGSKDHKVAMATLRSMARAYKGPWSPA